MVELSRHYFHSAISVLPSNYFIVAFLSYRFLLLYDDEF